jgi:hypothetical protein
MEALGETINLKDDEDDAGHPEEPQGGWGKYNMPKIIPTLKDRTSARSLSRTQRQCRE